MPSHHAHDLHDTILLRATGPQPKETNHMDLTFIGMIQACIGLILFMVGTVEAMFAFLMVSALFGGSAAIVLPALGGSSMPPVQFALMFTAMRVLVPGGGQLIPLREALRDNGWLIAFATYGIAIAMIGPRLFDGKIDVTPLRGLTDARYTSQGAYIYATKPLAFSSQNITTAIYLGGTLLTALVAHVVCSRETGRATLVRVAAVIGLIHGLLGFMSVASVGTPVEAVLGLFRNGNYAQLEHSYRGFVRMTGIWPEASSYASFAFVWFVFVFECWLRRIDVRWTGAAAGILAMALVFSTSSSAYVGLALYAAIMLSRTLLLPGSVPIDRLLWMAGGLLLVVIATTGLMIWKPVIATQFAELLQHMTFDKSGSLSAQQRGFWAWQGLHAFAVSHGIGIGAGSFRSSSLLGAILGSMGVIGIVTFLAHVFHAFKPLRRSTHMVLSGANGADLAAATGGAAAWAMLMGLMIASLGSPSCDPGTDFAILSGAALALRPRLAQHAISRWASASPRRTTAQRA